MDNERKPLIPGPSSGCPQYPSLHEDAERRHRSLHGSGTFAVPLVNPGDCGAEDEHTRRSRKTKVGLFLVVVSYFLGYIPSMVIMNPFIYDRVAKEYNYQINASSEVPCGGDNNATVENKTAKEIQEEIERRVSTLELYLHLVTYLSAVVPILLLGPITDRFGRRIGFLFPITGTLLKQVVYILVVKLELSLNILYVAHGIEAIGGSFAAMLAVIFSLTSDITRRGSRRRSGWIAVLEALQTFSCSLGQVAVAQWMRHGYALPLIYALAFCCLSGLVVIFFLPETNTRAQTQSKGRHARTSYPDDTMCCCSRVVGQLLKDTYKMIAANFKLYYKDEVNRTTLWKRRLCLIMFVLTVAVNFSTTGVTALFLMKYPLCWPATKVYTANGLRIFFSWVVILALLALLQGVFKMADRHIVVLGLVSSILCNAAFSLAVNSVMVYEAIVLGVLVRATIPMIRSMLSSLVDQAHQGTLYSGLSSIESLGPSIFEAAANRIYYFTLSTWAGEIFVIFAGMMLLSLIPIAILNYILSREASYVQSDVLGNGHPQIQQGEDGD